MTLPQSTDGSFPNQYNVSIGEGRGTVIGDHNVVIQQFTTGIKAFSIDYATRVHNFLTTYLGTAQRPEPFGGRQAELQALNHWLDNPQAPPYLLLASTAGRGKSALLTHWSQQLLTRVDPAVAFIPVSIRFNTNLSSVFFAALSARLATLFGDPVPSGIGVSPEAWRASVSTYLSRSLPDGRSLLVILDGVDEAADWVPGADLFPLDPPNGLRVVLSTRYVADASDADTWLERLGWARPGLAHVMPLAALDLPGVADVVRQADLPVDQLGEVGDVVSQLYRLTEGDALLVQLYVKDLQSDAVGASHLRPEDLPDIRKGLEGYFDRWWQEQRRLWADKAPLREPTVQTLLNLLACALGPLSQDDIVSLEPTLSAWTLEENLRPLARLIVGDDHQGYVFSHFRLAEYFYRRLSLKERRTVEDRLLDWGRQTVATLSTESKYVPTYLAQYYSAHLLRAGRYDELHILVDNHAWYESQMMIDPSGASYLNDVSKAWMGAEVADEAAVRRGEVAPQLDREVRYALTESSLHSLLLNLPPALPAIMVMNGLWPYDQALAAARQNPEAAARSRALQALAACRPEAEHLSLLREALAAVHTITPDNQQRLDVLRELASALPPLLLEEAVEVARTIADAEDRAEEIAILAVHLQRDDVLQEAFDSLQDIEWLDKWAQTLVRLILLLPESGKGDTIREAFTAICDSLPSGEEWRARTLAELAAQAPEPLKDEMVQEAFAATLAISLEEAEPESTMWWQQGRTRALVDLAPLLPEQLLPRALDMARALGHPSDSGNALVALVPRLAAVSGPEQALTVVREIEPDNDRAEALAALAPLLPSMKAIEEGLVTAAGIQRSGVRGKALSALTIQLAKLGHFPEALVQASRIEWPWYRFEALVGLFDVATLAERDGLVRETLMAGGDERVQDILADPIGSIAEQEPTVLALRLAAAGDTNNALASLHLFPEQNSDGGPGRRSEALTVLVDHLLEPWKSAALREALAAAQVAGDPVARGRALAGLLAHVPAALRDGLSATLREALAALPTKGKAAEACRRVLEALAPYLNPQLAADALLLTQSFNSVVERVVANAALAPYLPDSLSKEVLQEALEATRTMKNTRQQKQGIRALVPHLPESLQRTVLNGITTSGSEEQRTRALIMLAPLLSEPLQQEALGIAQGLQDTEKRALALAAYVRLLPEAVQSDVLTGVLGIKDKSKRARALKDMIPWLSEQLLHDALVAALQLVKGDNRDEVLMGLARRLSESGQVREAIEAAAGIAWIPSDWTRRGNMRAQALVEIAAHLPREESLRWWQDALDDAKSIASVSVRVQAWSVLAPHLPESLKEGVLRESFDATRQMSGAEEQANALASLGLHLPLDLLPDALAMARALPRTVYLYQSPRADALGRLTPRIAALPPVDCYRHWCQTLHVLAKSARPDLLWDLPALVPILQILGQETVLVGCALSLAEVSHWWP